MRLKAREIAKMYIGAKLLLNVQDSLLSSLPISISSMIMTCDWMVAPIVTLNFPLL